MLKMTLVPDLPEKRKPAQKGFISRMQELSNNIGILKNLSGTTIVVKCGGVIIDNEAGLNSLASDISALYSLGVNIVLIHGIGSHVDDMLQRLHLRQQFLDGFRVTNEDTMSIMEMISSGKINKDIAGKIVRAGGNAIGISCKDSNIVVAKKMRRTVKDTTSNIEKIVDLGFVGEPENVNVDTINEILEMGLIPVISPVAFDKSYNTYSINADILACSIASALKAPKIIMISDNYAIDYKGGYISGEISLQEMEESLYREDMEGSVVFKLKAYIAAMRDGVSDIHIVGSDLQNALLAELLSDITMGTKIHH